jgi:hypothetical protein
MVPGAAVFDGAGEQVMLFKAQVTSVVEVTRFDPATGAQKSCQLILPRQCLPD